MGYVNFIKTPKFIFYLHFIQDLVNSIRFLSLEFQKSDLLACHVPRKLEETKARVDSLCETPGDAQNRLYEALSINENGEDRHY